MVKLVGLLQWSSTLKKNAVFKNQIEQLNIIKFSDWDDRILNLQI